MTSSHPPETAALLVGAISMDMETSTSFIKSHYEFSSPAVESPVFPFDFTPYYIPSMGSPLFRRFFLFPPPFAPEGLADMKRRTCALEEEAARRLDLGVQRPLNLDPGYLTLSKLVLASTKDHAHRIYLHDGIYAEVTLRYHQGSFRPWPWTYPDYASSSHIRFFNEARDTLLRRRTP